MKPQHVSNVFWSSFTRGNCRRGLFFLALCFAFHLGFGQTRYTVSDEDAAGPGTPKVVVLRDTVGGVEAAVAPSRGGELSSFRVKFKGEWIELLYHARDYTNTKGFQGKGPVLWPAVGVQFPLGQFPKSTCGDGSYPLHDKTYPMPCHGFAKSLPWEEVKRSADNQGARVTVELRDSDRTRVFYPFAFRLDATFTLSGGILTIDYTTNADPANTQPMFFSIGNHIAFKIPFLPGTDPAAMTFESPSTTQLLRNSLGFVDGEEKARSFESPERLADFDARVAIPLAGYRSAPYAVLKDPQGLSLRVSQQETSSLPEPIVRFNIYGGPKEGYFSPEPWFGLQNSLNIGKPLVHLAAGDSWTWRVQLKATGPPPESPKSAGVERFGGGFGYIEGPVWSKQGFLIFSDMFDSKILKMTQADHPEIYRDYTNGANGNSMDVQGRFFVNVLYTLRARGYVSAHKDLQVIHLSPRGLSPGQAGVRAGTSRANLSDRSRLQNHGPKGTTTQKHLGQDGEEQHYRVSSRPPI